MTETGQDATASIVRKAGLFEKYHIMRHHLGLDTCVITSARYLSQGDTTLDKPTLFTALSHVVRNDRALSMQIQGEGTRDPIFVRLDTIDLSRIVEYRTDDSLALESAMALCWSRPFEIGSPDPLWRLVVLSDNTVVFAYHHAIGDGQSGLAFHRSLLTALNRFAELQPVTSDVVSVPPSLSPQVAVEEAVDTSVSFSLLCRQVFGLFAPRKWTPGYSAWTGNDVDSTRVLHNNVRVWKIPPKDATSLLKLCRDHHSTLTSFLNTVTILVVSYLLASKNPSSYKCKTVSMSIPISLRRLTNVPPNVMCNHVSGYHTFSPLIKFQSNTKDKPHWTDSFSWEASAKCASDLRKSVKSSPEVVGLLRFLFGRYKEYFEGQLGQKRSHGVEISNLGVFPSEEAGSEGSSAVEAGWRVEDVFFGQNDAVVGPAVKVNVVGSPSGSVGITFTWGDGAVEGSFVEEFVKEFREAVEVILRKGEKKDEV